MHSPDELTALLHVYTSELQRDQIHLQHLHREHDTHTHTLHIQRLAMREAHDILTRFEKRPARTLSARDYLEEEAYAETLRAQVEEHHIQVNATQRTLKAHTEQLHDARKKAVALQHKIDALTELIQEHTHAQTRRDQLTTQDDLDERYATRSTSRRRIRTKKEP